MRIGQTFLGEFDNEMANTRKVLERVPLEKYEYKPHEKSGEMGWLAAHVANLVSWVSLAINSDNFDLAPPGEEAPHTKTSHTREELLAAFDKNVVAAREALTNATDETMLGPWSLLRGGQTLFTIPRVAVVRSFAMNHLIHHRAQLTVYLRMNDVPLPPLYGPSADERP